MHTAIQTMMKIEKVMQFLVEAGYTPNAFLKPIGKSRGKGRDEEPHKAILLEGIEGSFSGDGIGFHDCLELPALGIIFAFRERMRAEEWLITAQQCGVVLPDTIQNQIAYSITRAGQEATRGKPIASTPCCPT